MRIARTATAAIALTLVGLGLVSCSGANDTAEEAANAYLVAVSEGKGDRIAEMVAEDGTDKAERVAEAIEHFGMATDHVGHEEIPAPEVESEETAFSFLATFVTEDGGKTYPAALGVQKIDDEWKVDPTLGSIRADGKSFAIVNAEGNISPEEDAVAWVLPGVYKVSVDGGPATAVTIPNGSMDVNL